MARLMVANGNEAAALPTPSDNVTAQQHVAHRAPLSPPTRIPRWPGGVDAVITYAASTQIGVAATKTFVRQIIAGAAVKLSALVAKNWLSVMFAARLVDDHRRLPDQLAGELKDGPLALISTATPVVVVDNADPKLAANVAEVKSRGGGTISIGPAVAPFPCWATWSHRGGPLESAIPLQILARTLALALGAGTSINPAISPN